MPIDFSKLDRPTHAPKPDRYALDDVERLAKQGGRIRSATVIASYVRRATMSGDLIVEARTIGYENRFDIVFNGARADDCRAGLEQALQFAWRKFCETLDETPDETNALELSVEGCWRPRVWEDRSGVQHKRWELLVSNWSYKDPATGDMVDEGRALQAHPKAA